MNKKKLLCCLEMMILIAMAMVGAMRALQSGIEKFGVEEKWAGSFAETLEPVAIEMRRCVKGIWKAVGTLPLPDDNVETNTE